MSSCSLIPDQTDTGELGGDILRACHRGRAGVLLKRFLVVLTMLALEFLAKLSINHHVNVVSLSLKLGCFIFIPWLTSLVAWRR